MTTAREDAERYDVIFVGAGVICIIEAVYQSLCGKSVLMIEREGDIGGAWRPLDIFGLHDVENAIHYFLPDPHAFEFMKDALGWNVASSNRKYRIFQLRGLGLRALPYDRLFSRLAGRFVESAWQGSKRGVLSRLFMSISDAVWTSRKPSHYLVGGAPEMLAKTRQLLLRSRVDVRCGTAIEGIFIDKRNRIVEVSAGGAKILCKKIVFTHGSHISNLTSPAGAFQVHEKLHRRPALHLLMSDSSQPRMLECIFVADPLIKYVHDVTRFAREASELAGRKKVLVLALHKDVAQSQSVYEEIAEKLKAVGMVSKNSAVEQSNWWDALLPPLGDEDLQALKSEFGELVEFLSTENFSRAIGNNSAKWASKLRLTRAAGPPRANLADAREPEISV